MSFFSVPLVPSCSDKPTPTLLLEEGDNLLQLRLLVQMTCSMSLYSLRMENLAAFRNRILQGTDPTHSYFFGAIVIVGL